MNNQKKHNMKAAKFSAGQPVIISQQLVGIVLLPSFFMNEVWLYRVIVDAKEAVYRLKNKHFEAQDNSQFVDDLHTLYRDTEQLSVMEISEEDLTAFGEFESKTAQPEKPKPFFHDDLVEKDLHLFGVAYIRKHKNGEKEYIPVEEMMIRRRTKQEVNLQ